MREKKIRKKKLAGSILGGAMSLVMLLGTGTAYAAPAVFAGENTNPVQAAGSRIGTASAPGARTLEDTISAPSTENGEDGDPTILGAHFTGREAEKELLSRSASFPERFDLRSVDSNGDGVGDRCYVTGVKFQNPFGSCWGFGAISAAETSILGSLMEDDPEAYKTLNLSEKQLAYFGKKYLDDPSSPQNGEGLHRRTESVENIYDVGGNGFGATIVFASGIGPVHEESDPVFYYSGKNRYTQQEMINGAYRNLCYSKEDDWSMDESYRFAQDYTLKASYLLPCPARRDDRGDYTYDPAGTAAIKEQLLAKRGVSIGFLADTSSPDQKSGDGVYMSQKNWAHFAWETKPMNHVVCIVGWDDNYPKENFPAAHQPEGNGAWLVKNSWGSGEEAFPNKGYGDWGLLQGQDRTPYQAASDIHTGYFWLSYYDRTLTLPESMEFDQATTEEGYFLDEYDLMNATDYETIIRGSSMKMANIFTAEGNERLNAVSVVTENPATSIKYEVYILPPETVKSPEEGVLAASGSAKLSYGGFRKFRLDTPVLIRKGQKYAIVVTMTEEDGKNSVQVPFNFGKGSGKAFYNEGVVNPGESMVCIDGVWSDLTDQETLEKLGMDRAAWDDYAHDNFPIKGFCEILPNVNMKVEGSNETIYCYDVPGFPGNETTYFLSFTGDEDQEMGNPEITWKLAEGGEKIAALTVSRDRSQATVKALAPGEARLIVSVEGLGLTVLPVHVEKIVPTTVEFEEEEYTYTGSPILPEYVMAGQVPAPLTEGVDFTGTFEDNIRCGAGKLVVRPTEKDTEAAWQKVFYFPIRPPKVKVRDIKVSGTSIRVSIEDPGDLGQTGYDVFLEHGDVLEMEDHEFPGRGTEFVIKGLKPDTEYRLTVCGYVNMPEEAVEAGLDKLFQGEYDEPIPVKTGKETHISEWVGGKWYDENGFQSYVPTGVWKRDKKGSRYEDTSGWCARSCWQTIDGKEYYFDAEGYMECDAYREGYALGKDGVKDAKAKAPGWQDKGKDRTFLLSEGTLLKSTWKKIDGELYYFDQEGIMARNCWVQGYRIGKDGIQSYPYKGKWKSNDKGKWYEDASGRYLRSCWQTIDGKDYYFDKKGYAECDAYRGGWYLKKDGSWDGKGKVPGWQDSTLGWYYRLSDGNILKNTWKKINGTWYYFGKNGAMATECWVEGYWIGASGAWKYPYRGKWHKDRTGWWFGDTSGWYAKKASYRINGVKYRFDEKGYCTNP